MDQYEEMREQVRSVARLTGAQGGRARAEKLSAEDRRAIAKAAANARWSQEGNQLAREAYEGFIDLPGLAEPLKCSVLDDGTRVFSTKSFNRVLGSKTQGTSKAHNEDDRRLPYVLSASPFRQLLTDDLAAKLKNPIPFKPKKGSFALGQDASLLPDICEVIADAERQQLLHPSQKPVAEAARILYRGFARIGIIALVDEVTGYQEVRARDELQVILRKYIREELLRWTKMFPDEFFKQVFRIHNWEYKPGNGNATPRYVGKFINRYVYGKLPEGVLEELQRKNPATESGYRRHRHFQFLSQDVGHPHLNSQIAIVTTFMRMAQNKAEFEELFQRAFPGEPVDCNPPLPEEGSEDEVETVKKQEDWNALPLFEVDGKK